MSRIVFRRFALAGWCAMVAGLVAAQSPDAPAYSVPPVYTPELIRPEIKVDRSALPKGAAGQLPAFDGERFSLGVDAGEKGAEAARSLVTQILRALGIQEPAEMMVAAGPVTSPPASERLVAEQAKTAEEETLRRLRGEFAQLSPSTEAAVKEDTQELRDSMLRRTSVFRFDQVFEKVRIDNAGVTVVHVENEPRAVAAGRVFASVKPANRREIDAKAARAAAQAYVKRTTGLGQQPEQPPELVLLPYGDAFRYAWRLTVMSTEGPYEVWVDARDRKILQLLPRFFSDPGTGRVFNPDPNVGTAVRSFDVDAPSGGNYSLRLAGVLDVNTAGADGACTSDVTVAGGSGSANFDVSPINGTSVAVNTAPDYNCAFQEVNAYAWVENHRELWQAMGSQAFGAITATVNHNNPCGFGINNACASGTTSLTFGVGSRTTGAAPNCNANLTNSAIDATVVTHEFGHLLNNLQYGASGGTITGQIHEGLADFWGMTLHGTDTFGSYWNDGGCAPVQTGWVPRQAEALDVFPEHRALGGPGTPALHSDGQMIAWSLWSARRELADANFLGPLGLSINLVAAEASAGAGVLTGSTDQRVHDSFVDLYQQLVQRYASSRYAHKIATGFARAGFFLSPRDAVIDIDDDYLDRDSATGPTFTVWTGRDYTFSGGNAVTTSPPFNTQFEIELANDDAFSTNLVSSGTLGGVTAGAGGSATWTVPTSDWNTLKGGDFLYYRLTTTDSGGGNTRTSTNLGNGFLAGVPPARAVINGTGTCGCGPTATSFPPLAIVVTMLPLVVAVVWRRRVRGRD